MKKNILLIILLYIFTIQLFGSPNDLQLSLVIIGHIKKINNKNSIADTMLQEAHKKIALLYLKKYESKDLKGIESLFSNDIVLRDWKIRVEGKKNALIETQKNFGSCESIKIEVLSLYENENTVAAELKIVIDDREELYVVDVITINSESKISSIRAFIGRGN